MKGNNTSLICRSFACTLAVCALTASAPAYAASLLGNISPYEIEIDTGPDGANLYLNGSAQYLVDWVNTSTGQPYGVHILDGMGSGDKDIFLTGGKENDTTTWNVGPGTTGSDKYDISQAYLANNSTKIFFAMERSGNNGTTAFDFEFNQKPPVNDYLPTRTANDVLFTFELKGSGGSGSATPHYYLWNGTKYVEQTLNPGVAIATINNKPTLSGPWGSYDNKGNLILGGNIDRFEFAEASVLLSVFPGFNACGTTAYVQVRTRSSATDNSDLKDTTKIFTYVFGGPTVNIASMTPDCLASFTYDGTGSKDSTGGNNVDYLWTFTPPAGVTLGGDVTGPVNGVYQSILGTGKVIVTGFNGASSVVVSVDLQVTERSTAACSDKLGAPSLVTVYPVLTAAITGKTANYDLSVSLTGSAPGATSLQWQRFDGTAWVNITGATTSALSYSGFESDATPTQYSNGVWKGKQWDVLLRLHAERDGCTADSAAQNVTKISAVDP